MVNMVFNSAELDMISDGLIALLEKAYEAKKLTAGSDACAAAIDEYARKIKNLNRRVCDMMEG